MITPVTAPPLPGRRRDGLLLAVGTLTALPVPAPRRIDRPTARDGMLLAPLAGAVPGAAGAAAALAATALGLSPWVAAALAVTALTLATRGLHQDGLADTVDGFAASYDRERALAVMRSGDTGPAGATALVLVLLLQVTALAQVLDAPDRARAVTVLACAVAGRAMLAVACARGVPAARPGGLGATVAGSVPPVLLLPVVLVTAASCALLTGVAGLPWWSGACAVAAAVATGSVMVARAVRRLGGVTGDVLGACVEVASTAAMITIAAFA